MTRILLSALALFLLGAALSGCKESAPNPQDVAAARQQEIARLNAFFARTWEARLAASPELRSRLGQRIDYDKWDDLSDAALERRQQQIRRDLKELAQFDFVKLDADSRLNYELFEEEANRRLEQFRWRRHRYLVDQQNGIHAEASAFLIGIHQIQGEADALAYIARLRGIQPLFEQVRERLAASAALGVIPPRFVFPRVAREIRSVLRGRPFEETQTDSVLLKDFRTKLATLDLPETRRNELVQAASSALIEAVKPAYQSLAVQLQALEKQATADDGVWKLPNGVPYYRAQIRWYTTTDLSPEEIHKQGIEEVERLQNELRALIPSLGFDGTLPELFAHMSARPGPYDPNTDEWRESHPREAPNLEGLPEFRRHFPATAYAEGLGLYAERLAKEQGGYADPVAEYGRLAMELSRAVRTVVDTGIHAQHWTRGQAIRYYLDTTPLSRTAATRVVERCIVYPGQATAYTVGLLRFVQLREQAGIALGSKFDVREFHQVVLGSGPLSLNALQRRINRYIEEASHAT